MPNPFTQQAVLRVHIYSNNIFFERLNCMPQTPEIYYPGSIFFTYQQIFETGQIERDLSKFGLSSQEIRYTCDSLSDVPAGTSLSLQRKKS